eukprot:TRINITY_DN24757_c0_g2_i2.p1 TRINITY_DN24757_c0_g2~~TRINITY_DN24757_c0_g2_i2.p1  ORF type:complete len:120 (-),score=17.15 TRINITY_DN24757_c0_g2_i2:218-577(-)
MEGMEEIPATAAATAAATATKTTKAATTPRTKPPEDIKLLKLLLLGFLLFGRLTYKPNCEEKVHDITRQIHIPRWDPPIIDHCCGAPNGPCPYSDSLILVGAMLRKSDLKADTIYAQPL